MPRRTDRTPATISASEFKATCLELMDEVARTGGEMVVTKRGRPVVRVSAVDTTMPSPWGFMAGSIVQHADIVNPDPELWRPSDTDPLRTKGRR